MRNHKPEKKLRSNCIFHSQPPHWPMLSKWFHSIRSLKSLISGGLSVIIVSPCCANSVWSAAGSPGELLWGRRLVLSRRNPAAGRSTTAATSPGRCSLYLPGCGKDSHSVPMSLVTTDLFMGVCCQITCTLSRFEYCAMYLAINLLNRFW